MIEAYQNLDNVTFRDLYEEYPEFNIQTSFERNLLRENEIIIFHFPLIWFGIPPLLKLWIDEVFDIRWFRNKIEERPLDKKDVYIVASAESAYQSFKQDGHEQFDAGIYLNSLIESIRICNMTFKGLITINNIEKLSDEESENYFRELRNIVTTS